MPCDKGMDDSSVAGLILEGIQRDRDRLEVDLAEKRIQLYEVQAGDTLQVAAPSPVQANGSLAEAPFTLRVPAQSLHRLKKGWYHWIDEDDEGGRRYIFAFANHKGACSLRRYDPRTGRALRRRPNRTGDYQDSFGEFVSKAALLHVSKTVRLEDCEKQLPDWLLRELQQQIILPPETQSEQ